MSEERQYEIEESTGFEPWFVATVCQPVLDRVPRSVHPNTISLITSATCWLSAGLAATSIGMSSAHQALAMVGAAMFQFLSGVGDCMDGMQARRTDRCSKLGEVMDHWLDTIHVPLVSLGICAVLEVPPWAVVLVHAGNTMIFNSQLVLQNHIGRFVATNGAEAQMTVAICYLIFGGVFYFVDRGHATVRMVVIAMSVIAVGIEGYINQSLYRRLGKNIVDHLAFVVVMAGAGLLHLAGAMDGMTYLLLGVFISFRVSGGVVLANILGRRMQRWDPVVLFWLLACAGAHLTLPRFMVAGLPLSQVVAYAACLGLVAHNLTDVLKQMPALRPTSKAV